MKIDNITYSYPTLHRAGIRFFHTNFKYCSFFFGSICRTAYYSDKERLLEFEIYVRGKE